MAPKDDQHRVSFDRRGSGPPLVLVHGLGSRWQIFGPILDVLAESHEVVSVDLPGFGESDPDSRFSPDAMGYALWLTQLLDELGIASPHVVGSSLGGGVALELGRLGAASRVTAFAPIGFWRRPGIAWAKGLLTSIHRLSAPSPVADRLLAHPSVRKIALAPLFGHPGQVGFDEARRNAAALVGAESFRRVRDSFDGYRWQRGQDLGRLVDIPVTIAWGTRDVTLLHRTQSRRAREVLPFARHLDLPGCGHLPFSDDPGLCAQVVLDSPERPSRRIAIIGTGFGGLGAAIELKRAGHDDLVIFERSNELGGVWRENTYPGAACDVPSPYYSFSYEPNPRWPRRFSEQPHILDYLRKAALKYDVRRHIRFNTEVTAADFDETSNTWTISTSTGTFVVDVLIAAVGQLSRPTWPTIQGRERFRGPAFHSAQWDHSVDLAGKRVAVIGTGASAIQFVPAIAPKAGRLTVFQRSPAYIVPRFDTEFTGIHQRAFTSLPVTQQMGRAGWYGVTETLAVAFLYSKTLSRGVEALCRAHMTRQLKDPELFAKMWPGYPVGCKRILFSNDYLPAITRPNVDLVTESIREVVETGVVTADGMTHEVDVIIYGTGFATTNFLTPLKIAGQGRRDLHEQWADGARAYLGITVPNFPNFFLMYGPNTNLGAGSIVAILECQARYIRQVIDSLPSEQSALVVRPTVARQYDEEIQARLVDGVWSKCSSWYRTASGRIVNNWPGTTAEYRRRTARFEASEFDVLAADQRPVAAST